MVKFLVYRWTAELRRVKEQLVFLVVKAQKTHDRGIEGHQAQVSFEFVQNVSKFGLQKCSQIGQVCLCGCGHYLVCHQLQHDELSDLVCNEAGLIKCYEKGKYDMPFGAFEKQG